MRARATLVAVVVVAACGSTPKKAPIPDHAGGGNVKGSGSASGSASGSGSGSAMPMGDPNAMTLDKLAASAVKLDGTGDYHRAVTASADAQAWFDQGFRLIYGFNHDEATRSFAKAASLDPSCAMCFWGAALTLGPNYNVPMLPDRSVMAWDALQKAEAAAAKATPVEQALIGALAKRYKGPDPLDPVAMQPFNVAYADAMHLVAEQFPDDDDVQVLYAESLMDVNPWKLWSLDGKAAPGTDDIVKALETVLKRDPHHPGANHYYIHAEEASLHPEKAEEEADRLGPMMPGVGHLVHMPAHIYQRVGRYADASKANRDAIAADEAYLKETTPWGYYPMYLGHNYGFLAFSTSMQGRSAECLDAAQHIEKALPPGMIDMMPGMDFFVAEPLMVMVRFGKWDDIKAVPRPDPKYMVLTAFWLHAQGMALASTGDAAGAQKDVDELNALADKAPADLLAGFNPAKTVFQLAAKIVSARIADKSKKPATALPLWADAVKMADQLAYDEPADWFYPVRHFQGAALLANKKWKDAEGVFREDLKRNPKNGWSLYGLEQALLGEKKKKDAKKVDADFQAAWKDADIKLTSSAL